MRRDAHLSVLWPSVTSFRGALMSVCQQGASKLVGAAHHPVFRQRLAAAMLRPVELGALPHRRMGVRLVATFVTFMPKLSTAPAAKIMACSGILPLRLGMTPGFYGQGQTDACVMLIACCGLELMQLTARCRCSMQGFNDFRLVWDGQGPSYWCLPWRGPRTYDLRCRTERSRGFPACRRKTDTPSGSHGYAARGRSAKLLDGRRIARF